MLSELEDRAKPFHSKLGILKFVDLASPPAQFTDYFAEVNSVIKDLHGQLLNKLLYSIRKNIKIAEF